jgi:hypothetical protein
VFNFFERDSLMERNGRKILILAVSAGALMMTASCSSMPDPDGAQYWQRKSVSDATYQQGPKAQQMLNRDIGRCVTELRELERLGSIKNAIPTDHDGKVRDPDEKILSDNDTPDRDEKLLTELSDYHDFEGCMMAKGWERVKHVPYDVAEKSRVNFFKSHVDFGYDPKLAEIERESATGATDQSGAKGLNE